MKYSITERGSGIIKEARGLSLNIALKHISYTDEGAVLTYSADTHDSESVSKKLGAICERLSISEPPTVSTDGFEAYVTFKLPYDELNISDEQKEKLLASEDEPKESSSDKYKNCVPIEDIPESIRELVASAMFADALNLLFDNGKISTGLLQKRFIIGYGSCMRIIDAMDDLGLIDMLESGHVYSPLSDRHTFLQKYAVHLHPTALDGDVDEDEDDGPFFNPEWEDDHDLPDEDDDDGDFDPDEKYGMSGKTEDSSDEEADGNNEKLDISRMIDELFKDILGRDEDGSYSPPNTEDFPESDEPVYNSEEVHEENRRKIRECVEKTGFEYHQFSNTCAHNYSRYLGSTEKELPSVMLQLLKSDIKRTLGTESLIIDMKKAKFGFYGFEIPNKVKTYPRLREFLDDSKASFSNLSIPIGSDFKREHRFADLGNMAHLLIGGGSGTGKSTLIHAIVNSLIIQNPPERFKFILIDQTGAEFSLYENIPHLYKPVISDRAEAKTAVSELLSEMERRYGEFKRYGVKDISEYDKFAGKDDSLPRMPRIMLVIDGYEDIACDDPDAFQKSITSLLQKSRAAGMHIVVSSSAPPGGVLRRIMTSYFLARIIFKTSSKEESNTYIGTDDATELLEHGDALFSDGTTEEFERVATPYISAIDIKTAVKTLIENTKKLTERDGEASDTEDDGNADEDGSGYDLDEIKDEPEELADDEARRKFIKELLGFDPDEDDDEEDDEDEDGAKSAYAEVDDDDGDIYAEYVYMKTEANVKHYRGLLFSEKFIEAAEYILGKDSISSFILANETDLTLLEAESMIQMFVTLGIVEPSADDPLSILYKVNLTPTRFENLRKLLGI